MYIYCIYGRLIEIIFSPTLQVKSSHQKAKHTIQYHTIAYHIKFKLHKTVCHSVCKDKYLPYFNLNYPPHYPPALFVFRYVFLLLILFLVPGIVMTLAYGLISLELYRGIKFEMDNRKANRGRD